MSDKIKITNFGPIKDIDIEVMKITIFVGPQAGGKSTLAKLVFIFKSLKSIISKPYSEYFDQWANDKTIKFSYNEDKIIEIIKKELNTKIRSVFGVETAKQNFNIKYSLRNGEQIEYFKASYGDELIVSDFFRQFIKSLNEFVKFDLDNLPTSGGFPEEFKRNNPNFENYVKSSTAKININNQIQSFFGENLSPIYIPAGRGAFSILSDQIATLDPNQVDELLVSFLRRIKTLIKNTSSFQDFLETPYSFIVNTNYIKDLLLDSFKIADNILRGKFVHSNGESRIYTSDDEYVKLNFASSGQQESIWIILICLDLIASNWSNFIVIEEPEAHLYPSSQFEIVKLISNLLNVNELDNQIIITTHSPYILNSINCLILNSIANGSNENGLNSPGESKYFIKKDSIAIYKINGNALDIKDKELEIIKIEEIDEISNEISEIQNRLIKNIYSK